MLIPSSCTQDEREAGNPVAALVHALHLEHNRAVLVLPNWAEAEEGDDDALTRPATLVRDRLLLAKHPPIVEMLGIVYGSCRIVVMMRKP